MKPVLYKQNVALKLTLFLILMKIIHEVILKKPNIFRQFKYIRTGVVINVISDHSSVCYVIMSSFLAVALEPDLATFSSCH